MKRSKHYIQSQNQNAWCQSQLQKQIPRPTMQTMWKGRRNTRTCPGEVRENHTSQTPSTHWRHLHGGHQGAEENCCKNRGNPTNNQQPPPPIQKKHHVEHPYKTNNHNPTHPTTKQPTHNPTINKNRPTTKNHKTHTTSNQTQTRLKPKYRPKWPPCDQGKYTLIWFDLQNRKWSGRKKSQSGTWTYCTKSEMMRNLGEAESEG